MIAPATVSRSLAVVALAAAVITPAVPAQAAAPAAGCLPAWQVVPSPNVGAGDNGLADVAVVSADDVWAVGGRASGQSRSTLIEHWDGTAWQVVPSPNGAERINGLTGVSAAGPDDVWAVGFSNDGNGFESVSDNLILHWDGALWTVVPSPNPIPQPNPGHYPVSNELYAVHAVGPDDVWAVGHTFTINIEQTLALHWDGAAWTNVPTPHESRFSRLRSVDAAAGDDVWAVGEIDRRGTQRTLTQHFDGTAWTTVPSPSAGPAVDYMSAVSVAAPDDVWVVGYHIDVIGVSQPYQTASWHYDGSVWRLVDAPDVTTQNNYLRGVVAVSGKGVLAVGFWDTGSALRTLSEVWNGRRWSVVPSPNAGSFIDELIAVDAGQRDAWAVGQSAEFSFRTLIMRFGC